MFSLESVNTLESMCDKWWRGAATMNVPVYADAGEFLARTRIELEKTKPRTTCYSGWRTAW